MERKTIKEVYLAWREMKVSLVKESTFATYVTTFCRCLATYTR